MVSGQGRVVSNSLQDGRSAQRDGTFSDVLSNDQHPQHPKTCFPEVDEFDEEALRRAAERVVSALAGQAQPGVKFPAEVLTTRLQELKRELDGALAKLGAHEESPESWATKKLAAIERMLRWVWGDGSKKPYEVFCRLLGCTWVLFPNITGASSQTQLLRFAGIKDKQQLNRFVTDAREFFGGYYNPLMRGEAAVENMARAARERALNGEGRKEGTHVAA